MPPVYQRRATIAHRRAYKRPSLIAEPTQEQCPQSVGGLFHVKRFLSSKNKTIQTKRACLFGTRHSTQRVNFSFVTQPKHSSVYSRRHAVCVVYPSAGYCNSSTHWQQATGSDRKASWRI